LQDLLMNDDFVAAHCGPNAIVGTNLLFVDKIKAPVLIAHGANDVRVVAAESEQMVEAMLKANKAVEHFVYDDEGHSLSIPSNKIHFYAKAEEFLAKYLGGRFEPPGEIGAPAAASEMLRSQ
jgi:dienelactone hydrolase